MVCYIVQIASIEFKAKNRDLLIAALKEIGANIYADRGDYLRIGYKWESIEFDLKNEKVTYPDYASGLVNDIKRAYSKEVLKVAAKKNKWILKKRKKATNANQFVFNKY